MFLITCFFAIFYNTVCSQQLSSVVVLCEHCVLYIVELDVIK